MGSPRGKSELQLGDPSSGEMNDTSYINPLCGAGGSAGWCLPDDVQACSATGSDADDEGDLEDEGANAPGQGGQGGAGLGGSAGGFNLDPGDWEEGGASCQVAPDPDCSGTDCEFKRTCSPSGSSQEGEPCVNSADCSAGLACVGEGLSGVCQPYCCAGAQSCGESSFCDERRLLEFGQIYVPVCVPIDNCHLTDPYPCEADRECSCPGERACMIVRSDGATACTTPGARQAGDECSDQVTADCAHGFVCGPNQICLKICSTVADVSGCQEGWTCLKQSALGHDLGICTESTKDSSTKTR